MKTFCLSLLLILFSSNCYAQEWWEKWSNFPKVPEISGEQAKRLVLSGEKVIFVYSGYEVTEVLCGSISIPYTLVPPQADGSRLNLSKFPKDAWILCYCP